MRLGNWNTVWLDFEFDPGTGRYSYRMGDRKRLGISGFGAVEHTFEHGRVFFCIYRCAKRIVFRAGSRSWALDSTDLRLTYRLRDDRRSSEFTVLENDEPAFNCTYRHPLRTAMARIDPTYDNSDFEHDHFLGYLGRLHLPHQDSEVWQDAEGAVQQGVAAAGAAPRR